MVMSIDLSKILVLITHNSSSVIQDLKFNRLQFSFTKLLGLEFLTRTPLGGQNLPPFLVFQNNSKTIADIVTNFSVPYATLI